MLQDGTPLVSIITVNYNHSAVTEELIDSIYRIYNKESIELIVVDNASKINPITEWTKKYPFAKFIRSEKNLGFAGGNNSGIKHAKGDYLFLVNNDTEFTEGLIEKLITVLTVNQKVGIVSPKIKYYTAPNVLQYVGYSKMNFFTARNTCVGQFEEDKGQYNDMTGETGYVHGAAMMVKRLVIEKAGMMAENFFLYYEELDWCERIRKSGFEIWVCADAFIYHKESMSVGKRSGLKEYYMNRNRILFQRKHAPLFTLIVFTVYFLLIVTPRNILSYIKNREYSFIRLLFKAIAWNCIHGVNASYAYLPAK